MWLLSLRLQNLVHNTAFGSQGRVVPYHLPWVVYRVLISQCLLWEVWSSIPKVVFSAPNSSVSVLGSPTQVVLITLPVCLQNGNCISLLPKKAGRIKAQVLFQGDLIEYLGR